MTGAEVTQQRLKVCWKCEKWAGQCQLGHDVTGLSGCPLNKFPGFVPLGNAAAAVFKPVAQLVGLKGCGGCTRRQDSWNHLITR